MPDPCTIRSRSTCERRYVRGLTPLRRAAQDIAVSRSPELGPGHELDRIGAPAPAAAHLFHSSSQGLGLLHARLACQVKVPVLPNSR